MSELQEKYKQLSLISDEWFPRIKKIFINSRFFNCDVIFVTNDDMVYAIGANTIAIFGGGIPDKITPLVIENLCGKDLKKVVFGCQFFVVLTESNELYTGGSCLYGRCGNGIKSNICCKPQKIFSEEQVIVDIRCGLVFTAILTDKQQIYAFGLLFVGNEPILSPTLIRISENITSISCGHYHVLALSQMGKVYAWGGNESGQLGLKHNNNESKPKLIEMPNNVSVKQISCGKDFSLLLTTDGRIYAFGNNKHGQLGHNNTKECNRPTLIQTDSKFTEILAFDWMSFAMNESNRIEFWGQNIAGEDDLSPHKSDVSSLQEAIIHYTEFPFSIEPIELKKNLIKTF